MLRACLPRLDADALCLVRGPVAMMDAVERALVDLGVPDRNIVSERFTYS